MEPQIRYVRSADGTNIAYYDMGDGLPLVISPNIWDHLTMRWRGEAREASLQLIGDGFRLIRYDMRGMGMSDRDVQDFSLEAQMADLEALRLRLQLERFALYSVVHAAPACLAHAARYPDRLTHLILQMAFAHGEAWYQAIPTLRGLESLRAFGDEQEQGELYTVTHASALSASRLEKGDDVHEMAATMRAATGPETLRHYFEALRSQDVTPLLQQIRAPTLVLQLRSGAVAAGTFSRAIASAIAQARLAEIAPTFDPPSLEIAALVTQFVLGRDPSASPRTVGSPATGLSGAAASGTAIILFTDIVDSTALTERLGDTVFRTASRTLDEGMRAAMREAGGTPVDGKVLGDGVMGVFTSASQAIAAARRCIELSAESELRLHVGLHAGDVTHEAGNVHGGAVNIASRICGLSAPDEILVSATIRELARTSAGVTFADRGEHALKGIDDAVRLYQVRKDGV